MKKKAGKAGKMTATSNKSKDKIKFLGRHPFYEVAEKEFEKRPVLGGPSDAVTWRQYEALYYASLEYDIEYQAQMQDEYLELEHQGMVKSASEKPTRLTPLGKKIVALARKNALMPG